MILENPYVLFFRVQHSDSKVEQFIILFLPVQVSQLPQGKEHILPGHGQCLGCCRNSPDKILLCFLCAFPQPSIKG